MAHKMDINEKDFTDELQTIDFADIYKNQSLFGNYFYSLTEEQIDSLEKGKVLFDRDEYGMFLCLKK